MYFLSPGPALFLMLSLLSCGKLTYLEATKVVLLMHSSHGEVRKYGRFFSRLLYKEENTYLHKYVLHSVHARTYCTNKCIEYHNMCNTATLHTVGLHIRSTDLSVRQRGLSAPEGRRNHVGGQGRGTLIPPP